MRRGLFLSIVLCVFCFSDIYAQWSPAGDKIKTVWAEQLDPTSPLPEYPRPQMVRDEWKNLNGLWSYAIIDKGTAEPKTFDGEILVPYAIESSLSGVQKGVTDKQEIWYDRSFEIPSSWKNRDVLLHFGAVDWKAEVYINDILIGSHTGGYTPFSFNITPYLNAKGAQKLNVRVWDSTDSGMQPRGKQVNKPRGVWYTPVSGIWQTVWLEPVAPSYIASVKTIPNLDAKGWQITVDAENSKRDLVVVDMFDGAKKVAQAKGVVGSEFMVYVDDPKLWSPDSPFLYDMKISLVGRGNKVLDSVDSYTAMRKISRGMHNGYLRMFLNNKPLFHYGPLDQGWWPDGLYTQPSDEALIYDIKVTKDLGYNMIRKHVKVESARWYYYCDKMGIMVWQDMPSGDHAGGVWDYSIINGGRDASRSALSKENYYKEWREIMDYCMSFPSIVVWVPFNEAWGQFDTEVVAEWTKQYDPSRLVNPASGGNHTNAADILDLHSYPEPRMLLSNGTKINVLGEYGGIGLPLEGHIWDTKMNNWGYGGVRKSKDDVTNQYVKFAKLLIPYVERGFAGAVYTQTSDVEGEVNGIMTYDRKEIKMDVERVKAVNIEVIKSME